MGTQCSTQFLLCMCLSLPSFGKTEVKPLAFTEFFFLHEWKKETNNLTISTQNYKGEENSPEYNWCRVRFCYVFTRWCLNPILLTVNLVSSLICFAFQLTVRGGRNSGRRWQCKTIRIEVKTLIIRTCASQLLLIIRSFIVVCEN